MVPDQGLELLTEEDCRDLLASGVIGRVGISVGALPAILPVNYSVVDGDILFRTGEGQKLRAALDHTVVAFQVDHADPLSHEGWSVLVVGVAEEIFDVPGGLRAPVPWARGERDHLVRIRPEMISGRRLLP
jgi:nitroimidazol reductase NimA-like FMN-containing flavoprotein (pyridoxamine 5'-phosphate oxidase superfamily)